MTRIRRRPFPKIMNAVPYKNIAELHSTGGRLLLRTGLRVTVTVPPILQQTRYPNLINNANVTYGYPVISNDDRQKLHDRRQWARAAHRNAQTAAARDRVIRRYSSVFDISDFVTQLGWSSSAENGFVEVNLSLDNSRGLFNYLPEAARITIWRRKSINNINGNNAGAWYPYIVSFVMDKRRTADGRNHTMSITCQDRAGFFGANPSEKKVYKKDRTHPNGWSPREITLDICRREGIPVNASKIPARLNGKPLPRLTRLETADHSVVELISDAWKRSVARLPDKQQRPYVLHARTGQFEVEFVSPPGKESNTQEFLVMFDDNANIENGDLHETIEDDMHTVLEAQGSYRVTTTNAKGRRITSKRKVKGSFYPENRDILKAYGKKVKKTNYKQVFPSRQAFRQKAQADIDEMSRPRRTFTFRAKGVLGLWPIRYVQLTSRYFGLRGNFHIENVSYNIQEGQIEVNLELDVEQKHFVAGAKHLVRNPKLGRHMTWY